MSVRNSWSYSGAFASGPAAWLGWAAKCKGPMGCGDACVRSRMRGLGALTSQVCATASLAPVAWETMAHCLQKQDALITLHPRAPGADELRHLDPLIFLACQDVTSLA